MNAINEIKLYKNNQPLYINTRLAQLVSWYRQLSIEKSGLLIEIELKDWNEKKNLDTIRPHIWDEIINRLQNMNRHEREQLGKHYLLSNPTAEKLNKKEMFGYDGDNVYCYEDEEKLFISPYWDGTLIYQDTILRKESRDDDNDFVQFTKYKGITLVQEIPIEKLGEKLWQTKEKDFTFKNEPLA